MSLRVKHGGNARVINFATKLKRNGDGLHFYGYTKLQQNYKIHKREKWTNDVRDSVGLFSVEFFETGYETELLRISFFQQAAHFRNEFPSHDINLGKCSPREA